MGEGGEWPGRLDQSFHYYCVPRTTINYHQTATALRPRRGMKQRDLIIEIFSLLTDSPVEFQYPPFHSRTKIAPSARRLWKSECHPENLPVPVSGVPSSVMLRWELLVHSLSSREHSLFAASYYIPFLLDISFNPHSTSSTLSL